MRFISGFKLCCCDAATREFLWTKYVRGPSLGLFCESVPDDSCTTNGGFNAIFSYEVPLIIRRSHIGAALR